MLFRSGLLTCLLEMCFANVRGGIRLREDVLEELSGADRAAALFAEYPAVVLQIKGRDVSRALGLLLQNNVMTRILGYPCTERRITVDRDLSFDIDTLREQWFRTSYLMDIRQSGPEKAKERFENFGKTPLKFRFPQWSGKLAKTREQLAGEGPLPKAAIIREKGSQCDREMAWMLFLAGFDVRDVHTTDLVSGRETLDDIRLIVFVGGFSNADTLARQKAGRGLFFTTQRRKKR